MKTHEFLGLDVGKIRTGIARGNSAAGLAEPLITVKTDSLIEKLEELIDKNQISAVVIGLPRSLNGNDTAQTQWVRDWVTKTKQRVPVPFYWQDEALTSNLAEAQKNLGAKHDTDSLAAAVILQEFLDTPEVERVIC